jgi:biotin carboxyl carrier protein
MNQRLVKVTVIFFVLMAVFTILSRAAYNMGVVEVTVKTPEKVTMSTEIKGSGMVNGKLERAVITEAGLLIKTVYVSVGDIVEKNTLLYELDIAVLQQKIDEIDQEIRVKELQIQDIRNSMQEQEARRLLALSQAQSDYNRAVEEGNGAVAQAEEKLFQVQRDYENYVNNSEMYPDQTEEGLLTQIEENQQIYEESIKNRDTSIYGAQKVLDSANLVTVQGSSAEQEETDRDRAKKILDKLNELLQAEGQIKSPVKGEVSDVSVKAGSMTTGGGDILLVDASSGMELIVGLPGKYRQYLQAGRTVDVFCEDKPAEILNRLKNLQIANIAKSEGQTSKITRQDIGEEINITIEIPQGTLNIGDMANIEVKLASNTYETCIPYSALHLKGKDNYYVSVIEEKSSVLGVSWVVRYINVELLEENEKFAAVKGLSGKQEVITESGRELLEGSRVKRRGE